METQHSIISGNIVAIDDVATTQVNISVEGTSAPGSDTTWTWSSPQRLDLDDSTTHTFRFITTDEGVIRAYELGGVVVSESAPQGTSGSAEDLSNPLQDWEISLRESFRAYSRQKAAKTATLQAVTFEDIATRMAADLLKQHRALLDGSAKWPYVEGDVWASVRNLESIAFPMPNDAGRLLWFQAFICTGLHKAHINGSQYVLGIERPDSILGVLVNWLWSYHPLTLQIQRSACGWGDIYIAKPGCVPVAEAPHG